MINGGVAGTLLVDSLRNVLAVHLLRHYCQTAKPATGNDKRLSPLQIQQVKDHVETHLAEDLSLAELAAIVPMSEFHSGWYDRTVAAYRSIGATRNSVDGDSRMALTVEDLQKLQSEHPDCKMELVDGEIIVMSPSGYESDEVAFRFGAKLFPYVDERRLGRVTGSSAGFVLPNATEDVRAPDVSFVLAERLRRSPKSFAQLAPDLMVEVKSPTDSIAKLESKIESFLDLGTQVGILINPDERTVKLYRSDQAAVTLQDGEILSVPDLLPGWEVSISQLWAPEFD